MAVAPGVAVAVGVDVAVAVGVADGAPIEAELVMSSGDIVLSAATTLESITLSQKRKKMIGVRKKITFLIILIY